MIVQASLLIYCDLPYVHSQSIIYGGQDFKFQEMLETINDLKTRGLFFVLGIDGTKEIWKISAQPSYSRWVI